MTIEDQAAKLRAMVARSAREDARLAAALTLEPTATVPARPPCRTIVVTSGKGGVGKTNISVNLALAFARRRVRTILFDADLGMANVDVILGVSPPHSLADVIRGEKRMEEVLFPIEERLSVVPGGSGIADLANLEGSQLAAFVQQLTDLEALADLILVDTGAGINRSVLDFVLAASEVVVVTTPEPTAITDAYGIIKMIDQRDPKTRVHLLVNMADDEAQAKVVAGKLIRIVKRFLSIEVRYLGFLDRDPNVGRSVLQQKPFLRAFPQSQVSRRLNMLAGSLLLPDQAPPAAAGGHFFSRLIERFR